MNDQRFIQKRHPRPDDHRAVHMQCRLHNQIVDMPTGPERDKVIRRLDRAINIDMIEIAIGIVIAIGMGLCLLCIPVFIGFGIYTIIFGA